MFKQRIVAAVVGGIFIFFWQFASWTFLGIHNEDNKYLPEQDQVAQMLSSVISEEGTYLMPSPPPDADDRKRQDFMDRSAGKPLISITFVKSFQSGMGRPMIRGFLLDVFLVYLLIYIFTRAGTPSFMRIVAASVSAGIFSWLWGPYTAHIWYQVPWSSIWPSLIDAVLAWGVCGLWLGWYLNKRAWTVKRKTEKAATSTAFTSFRA